jgi:hypothetical protein
VQTEFSGIDRRKNCMALRVEHLVMHSGSADQPDNGAL